jgi:uncharacterized membrane protein
MTCRQYLGRPPAWEFVAVILLANAEYLAMSLVLQSLLTGWRWFPVYLLSAASGILTGFLVALLFYRGHRAQ